MLNRRILRIKAFKAIYSYVENPSMSLRELESQLDSSLESCRDLYLFLLGVMEPLAAEARARIEASMSKFNPTEEELHPNMKFAQNAMSAVLPADPDFCKLFSKKKLSWDQYDVFMRHLYESVKSKDYYREYLESAGQSLKLDAELWVRIFEEEFEDNAELAEILEDLSIWWNDDLSYALSWCCRTVSQLGEGKPWNLPPLYMSDLQKGADSDRDFLLRTVRQAVAAFDGYYETIASLTAKWDKNRICSTDLALIVCGLAEHDSCKEIPVKVTINEYVEISKFYSTPESKAFVNGLLDKIINKQAEQ